MTTWMSITICILKSNWFSFPHLFAYLILVVFSFIESFENLFDCCVVLNLKYESKAVKG